MGVIETEELSKNYGSIRALKEVDLDIDDGQVVGILGPNGAGKSTLIKILTGQLDRDSGDVSVLDLDPAEQPVDLRKSLGILPEREDRPSFLTAGEYLDFVSDMRDVEIDKDDWIERFRLEGRLSSLTRDLSKGERQKLMIVQAFFHEPELVFIDEPLINLDPVIQETAKDLFREHREKGKTVFICTHVVSLAEELCDRVLFIREGEIIDDITDTENLKQTFLEENDY